jgi:hypothetical protein
MSYLEYHTFILYYTTLRNSTQQCAVPESYDVRTTFSDENTLVRKEWSTLCDRMLENTRRFRLLDTLDPELSFLTEEQR